MVYKSCFYENLANSRSKDKTIKASSKHYTDKEKEKGKRKGKRKVKKKKKKKWKKTRIVLRQQ